MSQSDIDAQWSFELVAAARLLRRNFDRRAKEHGLSRARWQVLWTLAKNELGPKQAELAELLDVAPISLARQLDNLEQEGLIERRRDPLDRRCFRIYLTEDAEPVLTVLRGVSEETRLQAMVGVSALEVEQLQGLLARVKNNLCKEDV